MKWDAQLYDDKHEFVSRLAENLVALLAPQPGERILDVGCGTGHLTQQIAAYGANVVGIDSSPEMISQAQRSYPGIEFVVADIVSYETSMPYDAIFSNAVLHWVHQAKQAVRQMSLALKTSGRLVVEFGGSGNVRLILGALEESLRDMAGKVESAQNYFPSIGQYTSLLEEHGIQVVKAELYDRPTRLEDGQAGLANWIRMFRGHTLADLNPASQAKILEQVESRLRDKLWHDHAWYADYRRLRIVGYKD